MINDLSAFLMLAVYLTFRIMYEAEPKNPKGLFELPEGVAAGYSMAAMQKIFTDTQCVVNGQCAKSDMLEDAQRLALTPDTLKNQYPYFYQSLFNLVQRAESFLKA